MALFQSSLSGAVWRLVIVGFLCELCLLAVYLHFMEYRDCGLHFLQCFLNSCGESKHRVIRSVYLPLGTTESVLCPCFEIQGIPLIVTLCSRSGEFVIVLVYT